MHALGDVHTSNRNKGWGRTLEQSEIRTDDRILENSHLCDASEEILLLVPSRKENTEKGRLTKLKCVDNLIIEATTIALDNKQQVRLSNSQKLSLVSNRKLL